MRGLPRRPFGAPLILLFAATLIACALAAGEALAVDGAYLRVTATASPNNFTAAGQTVTFSYVVTNFSTDPLGYTNAITVTDSKGTTITCPATNLAANSNMTCTGSYTTTATDVAAGSITNTVTATSTDASTDHLTDFATTVLTIAYTVPPTNKTATLQAIERFLAHRMSLIVSEGPDRAQFLRRFPGSLWGNDNTSTNGTPFSFLSRSSELGTRMAFSTSLAQIARAHAQAEDKFADASAYEALAYAPRKMPVKAPTRLAPEPGFDVWVEAHYLGFGSHLGNVDNDGHFGVLYLGVDRPLTPSMLLGALVQFDWMDESSSAAGSSVKGRGTMAGPYIGVRLAPNLFLDARAAWGLSRNDVDPVGQYTDKFSANRWLAHAKLTGNWHWQDFRLTPSVALDYIQEHQRDYTDALGVAIPGQTVSLGRLSFGPEIARRYIGADGTSYEPLVALIGQWDFKRPEVAALDGALVSGNAFRARAQAGLMAYRPDGLSMRIVATYDGIGDSSLHAYGGQIWVNLPLP